MTEVAVEELTSELPDLAARYDAEAGVLEIPVIPEEDWTNGIDLDALVVIDLTEDLAVANIDVLMPKERWRSGLAVQLPDRRISPVRLHVTKTALATKSFRSTPTIHTSSDGSIVQVVVPHSGPVTALGLTTHCDALISKTELVGFQVHLQP
jgi:hypothetical protein